MNPICGAQGPAAEEIGDAASGDHAMPDVEEIRNVPIQNGCGFSSLLAVTPVELPVGETRYRSERSRYLLESYLKDVRGLLSTGLLEGFKVVYKNNEVCVVPADLNCSFNVNAECKPRYFLFASYDDD